MNAETAITADAGDHVLPRRRTIRRVLMLVVPIAILAGAAWFYLAGGRYESTENAALQAGVVPIAASTSGKVVSVAVRENQRVKAGDILFRLQSDSAETAVAEAEAQLAGARSDVSAAQADYRAAVSEVRAAQARASFARAEANRQGQLLREGISSRAQYDAAMTQARTAQDAIASAQARADSLRAALSDDVSAPADRQPAVRRAASVLEKARIALGDTVVRAPQDGIVTRVHQLQVGSYVTAGRPVFMLTGTRFWVQANFKESQLRHMRVGQAAEIRVDAFPDRPLEGHVASFSPGTGSSFAVLPAENATGNWVKVVQRLPVEIAIDKVPDGLPLAMGLSAEVEVDTGRVRHLIGPDTSSAPTGKSRIAAPGHS